jgi:hypothetical protein
MIPERAATLATSDGAALEARLGLPQAPWGGIIICHPHPLYGGDMDNPVVIRIAEVCADLGLATLRFNFRGVGASTGTHGGGEAERRDVQAALAHLAREIGAASPVALAGYSFGAVVAADVVGRGVHVAGLALIAPPLSMRGEAPFLALAAGAGPLLIVAGNQDEYCPRPALDGLASRLPRARVRVVEGANHFFFGKLFPLGEAVADWVRELEPRQAGRSGRTR